jgi:hypothetical protein
MRSPVSTIISTLLSGDTTLYLPAAPIPAAGNTSGNKSKVTLLDMVFKNDLRYAVFSPERP